MGMFKERPVAGNYFLVTKGNDPRPLKRYFEMVGSYLVARENADKVPVCYLSLNYLHLHLIKEWKEKINGYLYVLRLTNIQQYDNLMTTDERLAYKWYFLMMRYCVGVNAHEYYSIDKGRHLGSGQYGSVQLVRSVYGGILDDRAVKVYKKEEIFKPSPKEIATGGYTPQQEAKLRFGNTIRRKAIVEEINILRKVDNPHLLKLYEVYEDHDTDQICIVTQAYYGGSLSERTYKKPNGRYSIWDCLQIIQRILEGLKYLHSLRIIHRDLKLENIMFKDADGSYDLAIIDFGFATLEEDYKKLFAFCGTKGYMAPEVFSKQPYGCKADMFSVGVIFYRLLTGQFPFTPRTSPQATTFEQRFMEANPTYDWKALEMEITQDQSKLLVDFMQRLITPTPTNRMSAAEALSHPLFTLLNVKSSTIEQTTSPSTSTQLERIDADKDRIVAVGNSQITSDDEDEGNKKSEQGPMVFTTAGNSLLKGSQLPLQPTQVQSQP